MRANELQQVHQRYFNSPIAEGAFMQNGERAGFVGSEKTFKTKRERSKLKYGILLFQSKVFKNGLWIGRTFTGSVRETFNIRNNKK
jgi:hypothetical protein